MSELTDVAEVSEELSGGLADSSGMRAIGCSSLLSGCRVVACKGGSSDRNATHSVKVASF